MLSHLRRFWSWLLPPRRNYLVPWTGLEIAAIVLLNYFFWGPLVQELLKHSGFFERLYGAEFPHLLEQKTESMERRHALDRRVLWTTAFCYPLVVATVFLIPRLLSNTRPYQLGVITHRLGRNALAGVLIWLLLAPPVLGLNYGVDVLYQWGYGSPRLHSLTALSQSHPLILEQIVIVVSAVLCAPLWEELFFRGLLQRWFSRRWWGGALAWSLALGLAVAIRYALIEAACVKSDWFALAEALQPAGFVLLLSPGLWVAGRCGQPQVVRAIFGTSLLFAIIHCTSWPDPVALFLLALGLGWLADRTRSLVGPIVLHSLFNGVACVMMFL